MKAIPKRFTTGLVTLAILFAVVWMTLVVSPPWSSASPLPSAPTAVEIEPNDTFAQANPITVGELMFGDIETISDLDYFTLTTTPGASYRITLTPRESQIRQIDIYNTAFARITGGSTSTTAPISFDFSAIDTQYYMRVSIGAGQPTPAGPPYDYQLQVDAITTTPTNTPTFTITPTPPLAPPPGVPVEVEPNDTTGTANDLAVPGRIVGAITNTFDVDCFRIQTTLGLQYQLILTDYGLTRWLRVYDNNGYFIMGNTTSSNHQVELTLQATNPASYYLCVAAVTTASPTNVLVDYLLEVIILQPTPTLSPTPTPTPTQTPTLNTCAAAAKLRSTSYTAPITINLPQAPTVVEVEPNDSFVQANSINVAELMFGDIETISDLDYYVIATTPGSSYRVTLTPRESQIRQLDIYNAAYARITGGSTSTTAPVSFDFIAQNGTYYFRVSVGAGQPTPVGPPYDYQLQVDVLATTPTPTPTSTVTPTPTPTPFALPPDVLLESEPNDTTNTADPLPVPGKIAGVVTSVFDVDCFSIDIASTLIGAQHHLILKDYGFTRWLKVYDNNGYFIMGNTTASNHEVELTLQPTSPRYYLCVSAVSTASPANTIEDYLLEVAVLWPTPTAVPALPIKIYLPLVLRSWPLSPPLPVGTTVRFKGAWYNTPMEGVVTCSENCAVLYNYSTPYYPQGTFVVVLMDVTNHGLRSDEVGQHNSFKAQDSVGRVFDLASLNVHQAAEYTYQRESLYSAIQPGFTVPLVFVFDVSPQSEGLRLVAVEPW